MNADKAREKLSLARGWLAAGSNGPALGAATHGALLARDAGDRQLTGECEAVARQALSRMGVQPALPLPLAA